jgi:hypothetical protein
MFLRPITLLISFRTHTDVAYNLLLGVTCAFNTPYRSRHAEAVGAPAREPQRAKDAAVHVYEVISTMSMSIDAL